MITFPSTEGVLSITPDALFLADNRTLAKRVLRPEPTVMLLAMIVFLIQAGVSRLRPKPTLATNIDLANLSTPVSCRAADVPTPIRTNRAWPRLPDDGVVRIIPKRSIRQVTLSRWTGLKVTTDRDDRVRFAVRFRHYNRLREALVNHGYLPRAL